MVQTIATNANNDIYLGANGNMVTLQGLPAVEAACATASKSRLTEQVLAQGAGQPMFETIWNGSPNAPLYTAYLRNTLSGVEGVNSVGQISTDNSENEFTYTAQIDTDFGSGTATATVAP